VRVFGWASPERRPPEGGPIPRGGDVLPLSSALGKVVVREIGCGPSCRARLASLGIIPGAEITVVRNSGGPLLLDVMGGRVALGRGIATKVLVELVPGG